MPKAIPVLGYPTRTAAVLALLDEGKTPQQVADAIGCKLTTVHSLAYQGRYAAKRDPGVAEGDHRGLWTPQKISKARRLFGKTMIIIAEALQVPPLELLQFGLNGVIPPVGATQRMAQLLGELASEQEPPEPPALPPPAQEPTREDDEAELAALAHQEEDDDADPVDRNEPPAEPVAEEGGASAPAGRGDAGALPPSARGEPLDPAPVEEQPQMAPHRPETLADEIVARAHGPATVPSPPAVAGRADPMAVPMAAALKPRVKMRTEAGEYLHENEHGLTRISRFIWRGTPEEAKRLRRRKPQFRNLIEEAC